MLMPLTGRPMLSTIVPSDFGGMIDRIASSTWSTEPRCLLDAGAGLGAHVQLDLPAVDGGKKFWPRNGTSANEQATTTRKPTTNSRRPASAHRAGADSGAHRLEAPFEAALEPHQRIAGRRLAARHGRASA